MAAMKKSGKPPVKSRRATGGIVVRRVAAVRSRQAPPAGVLQFGGRMLRCAIGTGGMRRSKREGDGATPFGSMHILDGFFRADRIARPRAGFVLRTLRPTDGWCDDPTQARYNTYVALPFRGGHEALWRADALYDVILVLDYNMRPRRRGAGSAIFFHCAKPDLAPTLGCVALRLADLRRLLPHVRRGTTLTVR